MIQDVAITEKGREQLSPHYLEYLRLIALGYNVEEIAKEMSFSVKRIRNIKPRVLDTLCAITEGNMIMIAMKEGILE